MKEKSRDTLKIWLPKEYVRVKSLRPKETGPVREPIRWDVLDAAARLYAKYFVVGVKGRKKRKIRRGNEG